MPATAFLTRENLEDAFRELGLKARAADKIVEIAVYGGSALVLTLPGRVATKDVDAVYYPPSGIPPKTYFGIEEIFSRLSGSDRQS